jgi:thiol-disulfide isomerase/thioredoxin
MAKAASANLKGSSRQSVCAPFSVRSFIFAVSVAAAIATLGALALRAWAAAPPRVGAPAPQFSLPIVVNGSGTESLDKLKGRGIYLNFFATWCQPCKYEMPYISKLSQQYARRHIVVIGVDELESASKVQQFAQQYKVTYPLGLDQSGAIGGDYGLIGLPLHVFIAPNGTIVEYKVGEMAEAQVQAALQQLAKM